MFQHQVAVGSFLVASLGLFILERVDKMGPFIAFMLVGERKWLWYSAMDGTAGKTFDARASLHTL